MLSAKCDVTSTCITHPTSVFQLSKRIKMNKMEECVVILKFDIMMDSITMWLGT
jgi:hypothetical protein